MTQNRDVFVSHASANDEAVNRFKEKFSQASIDLWIDHLSVKVGDNWNTAIQIALESCVAGLFVLTPESSESEDCGAECRTLLQLGKRLYVAVLGDLRHLPWRLQTHQYVSLNANMTEGLQILIHAIQRDVLPMQVATPSQIEREYAGTLMPLRRGVFGVVRMVLDMTMLGFRAIRTVFLRFLSRILGLPDDGIDILGIEPGSTVVVLRLPLEAALLLVEIVQAEPEYLSRFRVRSATLLPESVPVPQAEVHSLVPTGEAEPTRSQHAHSTEQHDTLDPVAKGMAAGAGVGLALGGPVGVAIGGILGGLAGLFGKALGQSQNAKKSEKKTNRV